MEKILTIKEHKFKSPSDGYSMAGYQIVTDKQIILLGISEWQGCCENWGYFLTNDDTAEFIGATLLSVDLVDDCLRKNTAPDIYDGDVMFVNLETDRGTLQFTAYNEHNGYYGHTALVVSEQLDYETVL